jgi:hypothetical protein
MNPSVHMVGHALGSKTPCKNIKLWMKNRLIQPIIKYIIKKYFKIYIGKISMHLMLKHFILCLTVNLLKQFDNIMSFFQIHM